MTAIVKGSIGQLAKDSKKSIAETFIGASCVVLVDTSGSMGSRDAAGGLSRYEAACRELASLQGSLPGRIAVLSFAGQNEIMFCPSGVPHNFGGGTDLAGALRFARVADVEGMRFVVISDGQPDSEAGALAEARKYKSRIDVIFVGSELHPTGRKFLEQLAAASGGTTVTADRVAQLSTAVMQLLEAR